MVQSQPDTWDVVVIGGGPSGENVADYAVQGGLSAAVVEADRLGGECSFWACVPSKALLRPVEVARLTHGVQGLVPTTVDPPAALARRDRFTHDRDDAGQREWATGAGIDLVDGRGRLAGERAVAVTAPDGATRTLRARHAVVLAAGSTPTIPPVPGLAEARPWTSRDATSARAIPRRVLVLGGGVVACEAATWLAGLGAEQVVLVEEGPTLLNHDEPFVGELVGAALAERGVEARLEATLERVEASPPVRVELGVPRGRELVATVDGERLVVDEILVAAGRRPATDDLGLEAVGLDPTQPLSVDEHLTVTAVPGGWLSAVGDVNGRVLLTHQGKYQARVCGDVIAARAQGRPLDGDRFRALADDGAVPQVVFTDPQVATVGLTEAQARDGAHPVRTAEVELTSASGARLARDDAAGRAKLVIDDRDGRLLGATFVGTEVAELLHAATIAVVGRVPVERLWHAVPAFPTASEVWLRLLEELRRQGARAEA